MKFIFLHRAFGEGFFINVEHICLITPLLTFDEDGNTVQNGHTYIKTTIRDDHDIAVTESAEVIMSLIKA